VKANILVLSVTVQENQVHAACVDDGASSTPGDPHNPIWSRLQRVRAWVRGLGRDPYT